MTSMMLRARPEVVVSDVHSSWAGPDATNPLSGRHSSRSGAFKSMSRDPSSMVVKFGETSVMQSPITRGTPPQHNLRHSYHGSPPGGSDAGGSHQGASPVMPSPRGYLPSYDTAQLYRIVCDWYQSWRPWQQRILLCGITNRCSRGQLESLATTLEPLFHRDFVTSIQHRYPSAPFKELKARLQAKAKAKRIKELRAEFDKAGEDPTQLRMSSANPYVRTLPVQSETDVTSAEQSRALIEEATGLNLEDSSGLIQDVSSENIIHEEPEEEEKQDESGRPLRSSQSLPANIDLFSFPKKPAVDKQEQQEHENEESHTEEEDSEGSDKEDSLVKPAASLDVIPQADEGDEENVNEDGEAESVNTRVATVDKSVSDLNKSTSSSLVKQGKKPKGAYMDLILGPARRKIAAKLKAHTQKSLGAPLVLQHVTMAKRMQMLAAYPPSELDDVTEVSIHRHRSALSRSDLKMSDFFERDKMRKLGPMQAELRTGTVKRLPELQDAYLPIQKMYKNTKWWPSTPRNGKTFVRPNKRQLKVQYRTQINQVWEWMQTWADHEKLSLLVEIVKLCDTTHLTYFTQCLAQRVQEKLDINWLPDKMLLLIFSYLSIDDIDSCSKVCRRWKYLCAKDRLWKMKCHEFGLQENIPDLTELVSESNPAEQSIDWKLAYLELQRITHQAKASMPIPQLLSFEGSTPEGMIRVGGKFINKQHLELQTETDPTRRHESSAERGKSRYQYRDWWDKLSTIRSESEGASSRLTFGLKEIRQAVSALKSGQQQMEVLSESGEARVFSRNSALITPVPSYFDGIAGTEPVSDVVGPAEEKESTDSRPVQPMVRGKKKKKGDEEGDMALDIRPELVQVKNMAQLAPVTSEEKISYKSPAEARTKLNKMIGEIKSVKRVRKLQGHMDSVLCIEFDRRRLFSGSMDRTVRIWDIRSGRSIHKLFGHKGGVCCIQLLEDGVTMFTGSWDMTVQVWNLVHFRRRAILTGHKGSISGLKILGDTVLSSSHDGTVRIWSTVSLSCVKTLHLHPTHIISMALDGHKLLTSDSHRTMKLINLRTGETIRRFIGKEKEPMDKLVIYGDLILTGNTKGQLQFWDIQTGALEVAIQAHDAPINRIAISYGRFYTAAGDNTVKEWDLITMTCIRILQGHKGPVNDFKINEQCMVSCSTDGHIRVWDMSVPTMKLGQADDDNVNLEIVDQTLGQTNPAIGKAAAAK